MKPKISPTSPKSKIVSKTEVEKLYQDSLTKIEQPVKKSANGFLWHLFFVIIIGFLSGLLALLMVLAYGPDLPYLNKILGYNTSLNNIITFRKPIQATDSEIKKVITDNAATIVTIFDKKKSDQNLLSAYKINESRGTGFVLTADGYIVTSRDVVSTANDLVIIDNDSKSYEVNKVIFDPSSSLVFLKVNATSLKTVSLVSGKNLSVSDNIIILQKNNFGQTPLAVRASISSLDYTSGEPVRSSSEFFRSIALSEKLPDFFQKGVAFTVGGEAVGMVVGRDSITTVVPFYYIKNILSQVLSGENPLRPTLGVNYFNLADLIGLPEKMSQGYLNGALIYSDQQEVRPSVMPKGPAKKAGLEEGDIIIAVDGHKIDNVNDLSDYILDHQVGDLVSLTVVHKGMEIEKKVTLEEFTNK